LSTASLITFLGRLLYSYFHNRISVRDIDKHLLPCNHNVLFIAAPYGSRNFLTGEGVVFMKNSTVLLRTSNELKLMFLLLLVLGAAHSAFAQQNLSFGFGTSAPPRSSLFAPATSAGILPLGIAYFDMEIPPPEDPKPPATPPIVKPAPAPITTTPPVIPSDAPAYEDGDFMFWMGFGFSVGGLLLLAIGFPDLLPDGNDNSAYGDHYVMGIVGSVCGGLFSIIGLPLMLLSD
jgi:hypothetical protein